MRELFVFPTEIEHQGTCQLVTASFPQAELCDVKLAEAEEDILVALKIVAVRPATFIHWAIQTQESGLRVVSYCYNLTLALTANPMPRWLVKEICSDEYLLRVFQLRTP